MYCNNNKNSQSESMADLLATGKFTPATPAPAVGSLVEAELLAVGPGGAWFGYGGKAEAFLPKNQLKGTKLSLGDKLELYVEKEGADGTLFLSLEKARAWSELAEAKAKDGNVELKITRVARKGERLMGANVVFADSIAGFIPFSLLDSKTVPPNELVGKTVLAKVRELCPGEATAIFDSRAATKERIAMEQQKQQQRLQALNEGQCLQGIVSAIGLRDGKQYGVFVTCDGLTGLVHRTEIPGAAYGALEALVKVGDNVTVEVLSVHEKEGRLQLSLSMKKAKQREFFKSLHKGATVRGKIVRKVEYGYFVEIDRNSDSCGLLHHRHLNKLRKQSPLKIGDELVLTVHNVDHKNLILGLSLNSGLASS